MVFSESLDHLDNSRPFAVDLHVGGAFHTAVDEFLETLITWSINRCGLDEFVKAKEEFYLRAGKVFYDDASYHSRMHYFLENLLFETAPEPEIQLNFTLTPYEEYLRIHPETIVSGFTHSLFRVVKIHNQGMLLQDLFADLKFSIQKQEEELFKGITKGDIFQGFVFHLADRSVLSRGLIFHPPRSHKIIRKLIKEEKKRGLWQPARMLERFARLQLRHTRLQHVDPKLVYSEPQS